MINSEVENQKKLIYSEKEAGFQTPQSSGDQDRAGCISLNSYRLILEYSMTLKGTQRNCRGGLTPWNTLNLCEEFQKQSN